MKKLSLAFALLLIVSACSTLKSLTKKPNLSFQGIGVKGLSLNGALFVANLEVENPNSFDISVDRVAYHFKLDEVELLKGELDKKIEIDGNKKLLVELPVKVKYADLVRAMKNFAKNKQTKFLLAGSVSSGPFEVPFKEQGEIELPIPVEDI